MVKTNKEKIKIEFLNPGEVYITNKPKIIYTILGSCVAVIFFHKPSGISAISHNVFPKCRNYDLKNTDNCRDCEDQFKYVCCGLPKMLSIYKERNIDKNDIEIKLFGGSTSKSIGRVNNNSIGNQNIEEALKFIMNEKLNFVASDTGGFQGRKIHFNTTNGVVLVKKLITSKYMDL
jgi:chemotaxis protein CheD